MKNIWADVRFALRLFARQPGFTAAAILSLALGIGANTSVFSVLDAVLLKSLPYPDPARLVLVWSEDLAAGSQRGQVSATDVADWRTRNHVFEEIATYSDFRPILTGAAEPERVSGAQVGDGFFDVMGAKPLLGRAFDRSEQVEGKDLVAVLSYGFWQRRFAGDPQVVGKTLRLSSRSYTVIGVMGPDFHPLPRGLLFGSAEFYRPVAEPPSEKERSSRHLRAIARLKPHVSVAEAQSEMNLIAHQLAIEHPADNGNTGARLVSLREDLVGPVRPALFMLFGAVAFLLLIACANIGNLLLARSIARHREVAIRAALGAGRARIVRQFLIESLLLSLGGGALGLLAAAWGTSAIQAVIAPVIPIVEAISLDLRVLFFAFAISMLTGLIFGCAPALRASRADLNETLNDGGRTPGAVSTRSPLRSAFVVLEVALALILLVSAGLLAKSMLRLQDVSPGFNPNGILTMNIALPSVKYSRPADQAAFFDRMLERVRELPGVEGAAVTTVLPVSENFDTRTIEIEGQTRAPADQPNVDTYMITPDYLRTMAIPLRNGRAFTSADTADVPLSALISDATARKFWPNDNPIGKRVRFFSSDPADENPWRIVVGVVGDVRQYGLDRPVTAALYVPTTQMPSSTVTLVVRAATEPAALLGEVRRAILSVDNEQPVFNVATMDQVIAKSIALRRISMMLLGIFAGLALLLAAVGIYGVLAQTVVQRTHEIGIRMALGAQVGDVLKLILSHGMALTTFGIVVGLTGALAVTPLIASLLFGVTATDPGIFIAIASFLAAVAFLACYVPARRAAKLSPVIALNRP